MLAESPCHVVETPSYSLAFGFLTVNGAPAPVGTVVTAESPRGDVVGCFIVDTAGQYGFVPIYGEDTGASPAIPGMRDGELVTFRVDGAPAQAAPAFYWHDDRTEHQADLTAAAVDRPGHLAPGELEPAVAPGRAAGGAGRERPELDRRQVLPRARRGRHLRLQRPGAVPLTERATRRQRLLSARGRRRQRQPARRRDPGRADHPHPAARRLELGRLSAGDDAADRDGVGEHQRRVPARAEPEPVLRHPLPDVQHPEADGAGPGLSDLRHQRRDPDLPRGRDGVRRPDRFAANLSGLARGAT